MADDTDRKTLVAVLGDELGWEWNPAPGVPSSRKVLGDIADRILTEFLPAYTERIRAEQREADAQIAASNLDRPWVASETPGDIARAIRAGGIE